MDFDFSTEQISPTTGDTITITGTGALVVPIGTTAQRPSPLAGLVRYNSTLSALEFYNSTAVAWQTSGNTETNGLSLLSSNGIVTRTAAGTYAARTITGTGARITLTNGDGVAGNPTVDIAATYVGQSTITTLGTITTGVWNGTDVAVTDGGTGASTAATARTNLGVAIGSDVQAFDSDLSALAGTATTGLYVVTGTGTSTTRTLTGPAAGITVSNGSGVAGNPTLALANDLAAVEGLATTGVAVRTAADTWTTRTITGTANQITSTNGDGVAGAPTISLPTTLIVPGSLQITTTLHETQSTAVSAAGATQGTATALTSRYNIVTTVAASTGVILPTPASPFGREVYVTNRGANALNVYPNSGAAIGSGATNAAVVLPVGQEVTFVAISATQWHVTEPILVAGTNITLTPGAGTLTVAASGGGSPAGSNTQVQFNNAGAFGASADFTFDDATNRMALLGTDTEIEFQGITNEPSAPSSGRLLIYAKDIGGRMFPKWIGPAGVDNPIQSNLAFNRIMQVAPASGTTAATAMQAMGTAFTNSGTISNPTPTTTNLKTSTRRTNFSTGGTAGTVTYNRANVLECWRGNAAGLGGFFYNVRFSLDTLVAGMRSYFGLVDTVSNPTNIDPTSSTTLAKIGMAINTNSGNWNIVNNTAGAGVTSTGLGANFPVDTTSFYELILFAAPNASQVTYRVTNLSTGNQTSGTLSSNLPASTSFLSPTHWVTNNATASAAIMALHRWYLETDY